MLLDELSLWRRVATTSLFGLASGLPILLVSSTLQAWLADAGTSLVQIGMLSIISLPYTLKVFWAPICDRFKLWPFDHQRSWIFNAQWLMTACFFFLPHLDPVGQYHTIFILAACIAMLSSTQDISIDSYCIQMISDKNRPKMMASYITGYRVGFIVAGGFTLVLADHYGWIAAYTILACLMLINSLNTVFAPRMLHHDPHKKFNFKEVIFSATKRFGPKKQALTILFILLFIKSDDAFILSLGPTFLLRHCDLSLTELGLITKVIGFGAVLIGSVFAGYMCQRTSVAKTLIFAGSFQLLTTLGYVMLALVDTHNLWIIGTVVAAELFTGGMIGTTLVTYLMYFCDKRWAATHYAFLSALPQLCRLIIGPASGHLVEWTNWAVYFSCAALCMIVMLTVLIAAKKRNYLNTDFQRNPKQAST